MLKELHDSPVVRTQCFYCCDPSSIPGQGTKILKATLCGQKKKKKRERERVSSALEFTIRNYILVLLLGNTFM